VTTRSPRRCAAASTGGKTAPVCGDPLCHSNTFSPVPASCTSSSRPSVKSITSGEVISKLYSGAHSNSPDVLREQSQQCPKKPISPSLIFVRIFISWSGDKSRKVAEQLRTWLPSVLPNGVETFVSSQDIEKGTRGLLEIAKQLADIDFGIIVLTPQNQTSAWINFESGALGGALGAGRVAPLLVDLSAADVTGPLSQFQNTSLGDEDDLFKLLADINMLTERPLPLGPLKVLFDHALPDLRTELSRSLKLDTQRVPVTRTEMDLLGEILEHVRESSSRNTPSGNPSGRTDPKIEAAMTAALAKLIPVEFTAHFFRTHGSRIRLALVECSKPFLAEQQFDSDGLLDVSNRFHVSLLVRDGLNTKAWSPTLMLGANLDR
jgi:hypothetical protein